MRRMKIICFAAMFMFGCFFVPGNASEIKYFAHRGDSIDAPENTLPAYELSMRRGADGLEVDVTFSRDNVVVMSHDASLKRVTGIDKAVSDLDFDELRKIDFSYRKKGFQNVRIPTFEETLAVLEPGREVIVDFKKYDEKLMAAVAKILADSKIPADKIWIMAFERRILVKSKELMPQYKTLWAVTVKERDGIGKVNLRTLNNGKEGVLRQVLSDLRKIGADGVNIKADRNVVDADFIRQLKKAGIYVMVWVVNRPEAARHFAQIGVDAFVSDVPATLRRAVEGSELR